MAKGQKEKRKSDGIEKKHRKSKTEKDENRQKREKKKKADSEQNGTQTAFSLLADERRVDPTLSSLFAANPTPPTLPIKPSREVVVEPVESPEDHKLVDSNGDVDGVDSESPPRQEPLQPEAVYKRKRKRKDDEEAIEDVYMRRLAREEAKEAAGAAAERKEKRLKTMPVADEAAEDEEGIEEVEVSVDAANQSEPVYDDDDDITSPPPRHETEQAADDEVAKANRTVFLGNVSTMAISSKSARKTLLTHLASIIPTLAPPKPNEPKHAIESLRFRSTPYASAIPKKAAFARKEILDATTKSTNAYAVYSSPALARAAATQLNGIVVLDRHLRVDSVAHPAPVDNRRCVFVGNLGFVDDETNANNGDEKPKARKHKPPADIEQGLWTHFSKCGSVESVRVIRDSTTRVGKGIAYVQFEDGNAVEAALLYDGRSFPPMLPRKLRVSRARAVKRNARPESGRPRERVSGSGSGGGGGYQRKVTAEEASRMGRAGKLLGRAGAAAMKRAPSRDAKADGEKFPNGMRKPEDFVFEGHRAKSKGGKNGLKLGRKVKRAGKPTNRSAKRGAAYKAGKKSK